MNEYTCDGVCMVPCSGQAFHPRCIHTSHSAAGIGSGSTVTLSNIKWLMKKDEWRLISCLWAVKLRNCARLWPFMTVLACCSKGISEEHLKALHDIHTIKLIHTSDPSNRANFDAACRILEGSVRFLRSDTWWNNAKDSNGVQPNSVWKATSIKRLKLLKHYFIFYKRTKGG